MNAFNCVFRNIYLDFPYIVVYYNYQKLLKYNRKVMIKISKKYKLNSKSDMKRLERDLKNSIMEHATKSIMRNTHEITCPHCQRHFAAYIGNNTCPHCHNSVKLELNM